jgi:hypothetical protein
MYYFDNEFLKSYLQLDNDLKVVINGSVLSISSTSDVENSKFGLAYDENGKGQKIDYRRISGIYINDSFMDLKGLEEYINSQNQLSNGVEPETKEKIPEKTPEPKPGEPKEEQPNDENKNENVDVYLIGTKLLHEYFNK